MNYINKVQVCDLSTGLNIGFTEHVKLFNKGKIYKINFFKKHS